MNKIYYFIYSIASVSPRSEKQQRHLTIALLAISFILWLANIFAILHIFSCINRIYIPANATLLLYFGLCLIFYLYFSRDEKDIQIIKKYKKEDEEPEFNDKVIGFLIIFIPLASFPFFTYISKK
jgi:uncharacterized membrane protein